MPAALSLERVILSDCVPLRDCMLTVVDATGEAAFLYFKEGDLVEANFATLWGKDALAEILNWKIVSRTVAPLPLGIKRSLWDPLNALLHPELALTTPSGRLPLPAALKAPRPSPLGVLEKYKEIPHLAKMVQLEEAGEAVLYEWSPDQAEQEPTEWLVEFTGRVRAVGETLGFGTCEKWAIETERNQIVGFPFDDKIIVLVRRKDAMQEDLETAVAVVTNSL